jgi:hypothetical protein
MGKRLNKWKEKVDKANLHAQNWGRGARVVKVCNPKPMNVGLCVADFEKARDALIKANVEGPWFFPSLKPKPVADTKPLSSAQGYGEWLIKRGYGRLGSGCFSTVYAKGDSDRVIKVTRENQDNWIDYIHWSAKKGYCGNFAPRVYSWKKYPSGFSVAVVERMEKTLSKADKDDVGLVVSLMYPVLRGNLMASVYMDDLQPGSARFFQDLVAMNYTGDLGGGNMMVRKDGSLCVTDPVCGRSELSINRLRSKDFTSLSPASLGYLFEI